MSGLFANVQRVLRKIYVCRTDTLLCLFSCVGGAHAEVSAVDRSAAALRRPEPPLNVSGPSFDGSRCAGRLSPVHRAEVSCERNVERSGRER